MRFRIVALLSLMLTVSLAAAQEPGGQLPAEEPPVEETLEPQVTIIQDGAETIEEYRLNGKLYMIKVIPNKGRPYYLVDADGDGQMETRRNDLDPNLLIPSWVLFRW